MEKPCSMHKYVFNYTIDCKIYDCFIDHRKAFDAVWYDELYSKLLKARIIEKYMTLLKEYAHNDHSFQKKGVGETSIFANKLCENR